MASFNSEAATSQQTTNDSSGADVRRSRFFPSDRRVPIQPVTPCPPDRRDVAEEGHGESKGHKSNLLAKINARLRLSRPASAPALANGG
jgi:hypothetical protein